MDNQIEHVEDVKISRLSVEQVKGVMGSIQNLWNEVDQRNLIMDLDPDYEFYQELQDVDIWFCIAAEYKGFTSLFSFIVQDSMHTKGQKQVLSDFIYTVPEHRGTGVADVLIQTAEDIGREKGATMMSVTLKEFDKHDSLIKRLGYTHFENNFQKAI